MLEAIDKAIEEVGVPLIFTTDQDTLEAFDEMWKAPLRELMEITDLDAFNDRLSDMSNTIRAKTTRKNSRDIYRVMTEQFTKFNDEVLTKEFENLSIETLYAILGFEKHVLDLLWGFVEKEKIDYEFEEDRDNYDN